MQGHKQELEARIRTRCKMVGGHEQEARLQNLRAKVEKQRGEGNHNDWAHMAVAVLAPQPSGAWQWQRKGCRQPAAQQRPTP